MKKVSVLILFYILIILSSCVTPEQALERRWYKMALRLSAKKIKNGKDVEKNIKILQTSADHIIVEELEKKKGLVNSPRVKDWIKVQDSYYRVLEVLGKANIVSDGKILEAYDEMCSIKKDLDFKIVEYYYNRGENHMKNYYKDNQKKDARSAYYEFVKAKKHGAAIYYNNIDVLISDAHQKGIVYYIGDVSVVGNNFFLKPLPENADFEPDCRINIDFGSHSYNKSSSESSRNYSKDVVVGKEEVKDTSGRITYRDIKKEVEATVTTVKVTVTVSTWTSVHSTNITGQCSVSSESFHCSVSDDYEEVHISGDRRAVPCGVSEKSGNSCFVESTLEDELDRKVLWSLPF